MRGKPNGSLGSIAKRLIAAGADGGRCSGGGMVGGTSSNALIARAGWSALGTVAGSGAAGTGPDTAAVKRSKNMSAICLLVASISRAPNCAILPPTCAFTS